MAWVSLLAFVVNLWVAYLFFSFREGDANLKAVWLDARNDVLGNVAIFVAALIVWFTQTAYADLLVAVFMSVLACRTGWVIISHARRELVKA